MQLKTQREINREMIAAQTEEYLNSGGEIKHEQVLTLSERKEIIMNRRDLSLPQKKYHLKKLENIDAP